MLPLSCTGAQLGFFNFHCKYSYYGYYKKLLKCRAVVRSCKNYLLRAVAGPRSCKKELEGTLAFRDSKLLVITSNPQIITLRDSTLLILT
jgi:hypothetical protein